MPIRALSASTTAQRFVFDFDQLQRIFGDVTVAGRMTATGSPTQWVFSTARA